MVGKVSLICPTVGEDGHDNEWFGALKENTDWALIEEIIVVWDEWLYIDGSFGFDIPEGIPIRYVLNGRTVGISRAFNMGSSIARGDYLCFLEDRIYVPKGWLTGLKKVLDAHPNYGWVATYQVENPKATFTSMCSLMLRRTFESMGGFDEQFEVFDDADLLLRMNGRTFRLDCGNNTAWYEGYPPLDPHGVSDIKVSHPEARTTTALLRGGRDSQQEHDHFTEMTKRFKAKWGMDDFDWNKVPSCKVKDVVE